MEPSLETRCRELVAELNIADAEDVTAVAPLTGGVASDIAHVRIGHKDICVKFALPKLKVSEDWRAPLHRNAAEYAWLEVAASIAPSASVELFGRSASAHGFAMEFVSGDGVWLWKSELLEGRVHAGAAALVGDLLGRVHAASATEEFDTSAFANRDDFLALRIEPYLLFTASRHPDLATRLTKLADDLFACNEALVHGDVSPKNILFRGDRPLLLDAECATMGSAAFDPAFCMNHLILKAVHLRHLANDLLTEARAFWSAYSGQVDFAEIESRTAQLIPALMLARVDGKSPVEYLRREDQDRVKRIALPLIDKPVPTMDSLLESVAQALGRSQSE